MRFLKKIRLFLMVSLVVTQVTKVSPTFALVPPGSGVTSSGRALYFQTNNEANSVVSVKINENGTLSVGNVVYTNGTGATEISAKTKMSALPDGLSSQGSVAVVDHSLFVVNSGDNTVSLFNIDEENPTNITLLGSPVQVPGDFPVSVAVSSLNGLVCVLTSGMKSGVSCAPYAPYVGIGKMDFLRTFDLGQSNPPVGPLNTGSQVLFSADESELLVTVKGDPSLNKTGYVATFTVSGPLLSGKSRVSASAVHSSPNGTVAMFGFQQIPGSHNYFVADAGFGAAIISIDEETEAADILHKQVISDQQATCWVSISSASGSAFVSDPLVNHIVEMSLTDASIISVINTTSFNDASRFIDLAAAGNNVYALSPGAEEGTGAQVAVLSVVDSLNKSISQMLSVGSWAGSSSQGLAVFP
ncbi:uncharacterized protein ZBIST_5070 [Zygosaccharomyces bailii]|nr:uncharacterized protein ZBIST_5070 [Zygosaccharomyces bailii]